MGMVVQHNMSAANANRQLGISASNLSKSTEKLSSGYRINRAGDDAAGLAISEKMRGQIRGLDQASSNAEDGISLVQTAEGALQESQNIIQRMRELAVQAASDTNTQDDREQIQSEISELTQEVDRIANTTEFNTMKLLDGSKTGATQFNSGSATSEGTFTNGVVSVDVSKDTTEVMQAGTAVNDVIRIEFLANGGDEVDFSATAEKAEEDGENLSLVSNGGVTNDANNVKITTLNGTAVEIAAGDEDGELKITISGATFAEDDSATMADLKALDRNDTEEDGYEASGSISFTIKNAGNIQSGDVVTLNLAKATLAGAAALTDPDDTSSEPTSNSLRLQVGANAGQEINVSINSMKAADLGLTQTKDNEGQALDVTSQTGASLAVEAYDNALQKVSTERSKLGAKQNRLEHTINNLDTSAENLQSAESRIRDVDMAKEMTTYSKYNILQQAGQSMLAQANQSTQGVLSLLG